MRVAPQKHQLHIDLKFLRERHFPRSYALNPPPHLRSFGGVFFAYE